MLADRLVLNYIVKSMKPLSTVCDPNFIAMIKGFSRDTSIKVLSRHSLENQLKEHYDSTISQLKLELASVQYICLTADCWSSHARAFLGVTCHWISESFSRESRTLSCLRFTGSHTYDKIAQNLVDVMKKFDIPLQKVVNIVTDNGSNFCKAFREFTVDFDGDEDEDEDDRQTDDDSRVKLCHVNDPDDNQVEEFGGEDSDDEELYKENAYNVLKKKSGVLKLPPHFKCISHTMSLIATTDLKKAKGRRLYNKVLGKCTKLWNLSTSPKSAEIIVSGGGKNLIRPVPTRWNSLFNAINRLLEMKSNLNEICTKLGVPVFSEKELDFLEEYSTVSAPVAHALDRMQGEFGLFMGAVIPTLKQTERKLMELRTNAKQCEPFLDAYLYGINHRFGSLLNYNPGEPSELVLASLSNPFFKLRWAPQSEHETLKKAFLTHARKFYIPMSNQNFKPSSSMKEDFYDFEENLEGAMDSSDSDPIELECYMYFNDQARDISMLAKYETVRKMFMRYNTSLPSSAPVERLFSYGGLILSARRSRLSDLRFEQLVMLKCNSVFKD